MKTRIKSEKTYISVLHNEMTKTENDKVTNYNYFTISLPYTTLKCSLLNTIRVVSIDFFLQCNKAQQGTKIIICDFILQYCM